MKKMLKKQMKGVPESEQEKIFGIIEKHPDFFQKVAGEVQQKMASGKDQMTAVMEVMKDHEEEMKQVLGK
jgi:2-oxo-4-hydroxy-4-carboxy--5-ureidoimidazoline (OHCU) decarboxylase